VAAAVSGFCQKRVYPYPKNEVRLACLACHQKPHPKLLEIVLQFQFISMLINNNNSDADATRKTTATTATATATIMKATLIPRYFSRVWHVSLDFPVLDSYFRIFVTIPSLPSLSLILRGIWFGRRQDTRHAARRLCDKLGFKAGVFNCYPPDSIDKWPKLCQWTAKLLVLLSVLW